MNASEALAHHLAKRPVSPGAVGANHPSYIAYYKALSKWTLIKESLEIGVRVNAPVSGKHPWSLVLADPKPLKIKEKACKNCGDMFVGRKSRCIDCHGLALADQRKVETEKQRERRRLIHEEGMRRRSAA
jgi:hypothetical protein